ncbi:MAG: hypothetical protein JWO50_356 [Candidatus Kaiserbacteria bacterium]|nr:hypothetical protein [Candidatus Kaiserbacteria bacterium]
MSTKNYMAWVTLLLGILAWGGVYYLWNITQLSQIDYSQNASRVQQSSNVTEFTARVHTVYQDTTADRASLDDAMTLDPLKVTDLIGQAVIAANTVSIKLSNPTTENSAAGSKTTPVQAFGFIASATGSFSDVSRALLVLERLPIAVSIDTVDIGLEPTQTQTKNQSAHTWHLNAHLRVFTTTND